MIPEPSRIIDASLLNTLRNEIYDKLMDGTVLLCWLYIARLVFEIFEPSFRVLPIWVMLVEHLPLYLDNVLHYLE